MNKKEQYFNKYEPKNLFKSQIFIQVTNSRRDNHICIGTKKCIKQKSYLSGLGTLVFFLLLEIHMIPITRKRDTVGRTSTLEKKNSWVMQVAKILLSERPFFFVETKSPNQRNKQH